jgi:hypothetical protein
VSFGSVTPDSRLLTRLAWLALLVAAPVSAQQAPLRVTATQFHALRWLEGRWRGERPDAAPFYEEYVFLDDSTLATRTFADSAFQRATDSSQVRLRGGEVVNQSGPRRWALSAIDSVRVRFTPVAHAHNAFTWRRESPDAWTATLRWPARIGRRTRTVIYRMTRMGPAAEG